MNSSLVRKAIDISYVHTKMGTSFRWSIINGLLFLVFACDLWCKCPHYTTYVHYAECAAAALLALSTLHHAARYLLLRLRSANARPAPLSPVSPPSLDSLDSLASLSRSWADASAGEDSQQHSWRGADSPHSAHSPHSTSASASATRDRFIADRRTLSDYLKEYEERGSREASAGGGGGAVDASGLRAHRRPHYQLAPLAAEGKAAEEEAGRGAAGGGSPLVWRRLRLDPHHLTQWNLNLRLWLHVTVLERLVREVRATDAALLRLGLADVRIGHVGVERLRATARSAAAAHATALPALLPYLEPFANQEYLVQRLAELAAGGCLSAYRWNGGGSFRGRPWDETLPTDAELLVQLFATYMDGQLVGGGAGAGEAAAEARPFSTAHVSRAPSRPRRAPGALVLHQSGLRPPHFVLVRDEHTLELDEGRNNLLHTLLLLLHVVATERRGMLGRVHLGRCSLNLLWVVGR